MPKLLNRKSHKSFTEKKKFTRCWYCRYNHPKGVIDEDGCCRKCGTTLRKYPTRASHRYPDLGTKLEREVLGHREHFTIPADDAKGDW